VEALRWPIDEFVTEKWAEIRPPRRPARLCPTQSATGTGTGLHETPGNPDGSAGRIHGIVCLVFVLDARVTSGVSARPGTLLKTATTVLADLNAARSNSWARQPTVGQSARRPGRISARSRSPACRSDATISSSCSLVMRATGTDRLMA